MRGLLPLALAALPLAAAAQAPEAALIEEGRYLAVAGDCAGCHGTDLAGGDPVPSPIGDIYASNITPDRTGIGGWSLEDFAGVMRAGDGPEGHIYPAMPYTSYTGLTDGQIAALYAYLQEEVEPVANVPSGTDLGFPFYRWLMPAWNLLFLDRGEPTGAVPVTGEMEARGRMLVETLGHCGACHTPRGQLMQQLADRHLAGAMIGGWWAPNITPHPDGTGDWTDEELARFLATGHTARAVAAGEMGTVVSRSLSHLPAEDIAAIVAYLRAVPPVPSERPDPLPGGALLAVAPPVEEAADIHDWRATLGHDTLDGAVLYQAACASCHGIAGGGSAELIHPSLRRVVGNSASGANLVQVIAHGVDREVDGVHVLMPGFRDALSDAQIASLANYVRVSFGGVEGDLDAARVSAVLDGEVGTPWLIANARWLAALGLGIVGLALLALLVWLLLRAGPRGRRSA